MHYSEIVHSKVDEEGFDITSIAAITGPMADDRQELLDLIEFLNSPRLEVSSSVLR